MVHAQSLERDSCPSIMKGGAGLVGPERFVRSAIFLDELVVEDCVEIRQLIDSIIFFFTEGLIFPDYVAVVQV